MSMRKMIVILSPAGHQRHAFFEGGSRFTSGETGDEAAVKLLRESDAPAGEYECEVQPRPSELAAPQSWITRWTPPDSLVYDFAALGS